MRYFVPVPILCCLPSIQGGATPPSALDLTNRLCSQDVARTNSENFTEGCQLTFTALDEGNIIYAFNDPQPDVCTGDYIFPLFYSEPLWNRQLRAIMYLCLLGWCFLGVAIISDNFMAAIEVVTAQERVVMAKDESGNLVEKKVFVWNDTVANLSLMALGSSAPEILLSVIETVGSLDKVPEDGLGASTIVGSAAFNLFMITAICMPSIPNGEKRDIEDYGVFIITSSFSVFAYVWMLFVLNDSVITPLEAVLTFLYFPLLLLLSWAQSNKWWGHFGCNLDLKVIPEAHISAENRPRKLSITPLDARLTEHHGVIQIDDDLEGKLKVSEMIQKMEPKDFEKMTPEQIALKAADEMQSFGKSSRMRYRINAIHQMVGGKRVVKPRPRPSLITKTMSLLSPKLPKASPFDEVSFLPIITFQAGKHSVNEGAGSIFIPVLRIGDLSLPSTVHYETQSGTAIAGDDYVHVQGKLEFAPQEEVKEIKIEIVNDQRAEDDENFFVNLMVKGGETSNNVNLKDATFIKTEVVIIDDDAAGFFSFTEGAMAVKESDKKLNVTVTRSNGCDGPIKVKYATVNGTARDGKDYHATMGMLLFAHGEVEKQFEIVIIDDKEYSKDVNFGIELEFSDEETQAEFGEHKFLSVTITNDANYAMVVDQITELMHIHLEQMDLSTETWGEQIKNALTVQGEDGEEPSTIDMVMHILTFGWKVLFSIVPPTSYFNGWLSFVVSLMLIGVVTVAVGDIAKIFGCLIGIPNPLTAITLVALGTSLPDTFASKLAAVNDRNADAAVGNVTGSNAVNVFLGLGLPWMIGAFYKQSQGKEFIVLSGTLEKSVTIFCVCAAAFFVIMTVRRRMGWGELGGPSTPKYISALLLMMLWIGYVVASALTMS